MQKIASPQDLQTELQRLLAYSQEPNPSREKLAGELRGLANRVAAFKVKKQRSAFPNTTLWLVTDPSQKMEGAFGQVDKIVGHVLHAKPRKMRGQKRPEPYTAYVGAPSPGALGKRYVYNEDEKLERAKEVGSFWDEAEIKKLEAAGDLSDADTLLDRVKGSLGGLDAALKAVQQKAH